jgi:hypothetical protein
VFFAALILWGIGHWLASQREQPQPPEIMTRAPPTIARPTSRITTNASGVPARTAQTSEIEICGIGKVRADPDDPGAAKFVTALTQETLLRWIAALRNSDDNRARAVGLYVENILDRDVPQMTREDAQNELVQLAVGTVDPAVYALAYSKCNSGFDGQSPTAACGLLSPQGWAQRDPDNAAPWLAVAARAQQESNPAAEADAFAHIAKAQKYDPYDSLLAFAELESPADATSLERRVVENDMIGIEATIPAPIRPTFGRCAVEAMRDPAVHQQCAALAELFASTGKTLMDLAFATSLGSRLGWAPERLKSLKQRFYAAMGTLEQAIPAGDGKEWSCRSVERGNAYMAERMRLGELGAAQELIDRSGESIPELARKYQESLAESLRRAQPPVP